MKKKYKLFSTAEKLRKEYASVASNYFHMTFLSILNSFFYFITYPFVIMKVGMEAYGLYVFLNGIVAFFSILISFGFDIPAAGYISKNPSNKKEHSKLISTILLARIILLIISILMFCFLLTVSDLFLKNFTLFLSCFLTAFSIVFLPTYYFHGMQKMIFLTCIQLFFKFISLPFILFFVDNSGISTYAFIISSTNLAISLVSILFIQYYFSLNINLRHISAAINLMKKNGFFLPPLQSIISNKRV